MTMEQRTSKRVFLARGAAAVAGVAALAVLPMAAPANAAPAPEPPASQPPVSAQGVGPWVQEGGKDCGNPYMHIRVDVQAAGKVWLDWVDGDWNSPYVRSTLVQESVAMLNHTVHTNIAKGKWRLRVENPWGASQPADQLGIAASYVNCELNGS